MSKRLNDRLALVTGASRGIGRALAVALAAEGAHLILIARTEGGLTEADDEIRAAGGSATLVPLDLADSEGIDRLGGSVFERWGKLDILVGNAGMLGPLSPLGHVEPKAWDQVMAINVTANWRLIRAFDPLLRQSDGGRAVFVTSGAARSAPAYWGPYATSKAALEVLVRTYAQEVADSAIRVNLVNPGPVRTAMRAKAMPGEDPASLPAPEALAPKIVDMVTPEFTRHSTIYDFPGDRFIEF